MGVTAVLIRFIVIRYDTQQEIDTGGFGLFGDGNGFSRIIGTDIAHDQGLALQFVGNDFKKLELFFFRHDGSFTGRSTKEDARTFVGILLSQFDSGFIIDGTVLIERRYHGNNDVRKG